jgi:hypothetical protein
MSRTACLGEQNLCLQKQNSEQYETKQKAFCDGFVSAAPRNVVRAHSRMAKPLIGGRISHVNQAEKPAAEQSSSASRYLHALPYDTLNKQYTAF